MSERSSLAKTQIIRFYEGIGTINNKHGESISFDKALINPIPNYYLLFPMDLSEYEIEYFMTNTNIRYRSVYAFLCLLKQLRISYDVDMEHLSVSRLLDSMVLLEDVDEYILLAKQPEILDNPFHYFTNTKQPLIVIIICLILCKLTNSLKESNVPWNDHGTKIFSELLTTYSKNISFANPELEKQWQVMAKFARGESVSVKETLKIRGLTFIDNSCFIDSTLFSLFGLQIVDLEKFGHKDACGMENYGLELKQKISDVVSFMRHESDCPVNCLNFRQTMKKCKELYNYSTDETQDIGEFIMSLYTIFKEDLMEILTDTEKDGKSSQTTSTAPPIIPIMLNKSQSFIKLSDYSNVQTISSDIHIQKQFYNLLNNTDYLIFTIFRNVLGHKLHTPVELEYRIHTTKNKKPITMNLSSVIIHQSNHFTVAFLVDNHWFLYDDFSSQPVRISSKEQDSLTKKIQHNSVVYIYSQRSI